MKILTHILTIIINILVFNLCINNNLYVEGSVINSNKDAVTTIMDTQINENGIFMDYRSMLSLYSYFNFREMLSSRIFTYEDLETEFPVEIKGKATSKDNIEYYFTRYYDNSNNILYLFFESEDMRPAYILDYNKTICTTDEFKRTYENIDWEIDNIYYEMVKEFESNLN